MALDLTKMVNFYMFCKPSYMQAVAQTHGISQVARLPARLPSMFQETFTICKLKAGSSSTQGRVYTTLLCSRSLSGHENKSMPANIAVL